MDQIRWVHLPVWISSLSPCPAICFFSGGLTASFRSYFLALLFISTVSTLPCILRPVLSWSAATFEHPSPSLHLCCCLLLLTLGCNGGACLCEDRGLVSTENYHAALRSGGESSRKALSMGT